MVALDPPPRHLDRREHRQELLGERRRGGRGDVRPRVRGRGGERGTERLYRDRAEAVVRLAPGVTLPRAVPLDGPAGPDGRTVVRVPIESVEHAHADFLRLGTDIEVLGPPELRERIARTVTELAARYGNSPVGGGD
nr:WYL domain-containing protein [Streptomyces asoensis]